jgi:hypothetical protein
MFDGQNLSTGIDVATASLWLHIIFSVFAVVRRVLFLRYKTAINPVIDPSETGLIL